METETSREEWLAQRKTGIGASEIGAICGVNPYVSPLQIYLEKLNLVGPREENDAMKMGVRMEPVIAEMYSEKTGRALTPGVLTRHPEHHWIFATPDRFVVGEPRGVEIKHASMRMASQWGEGSDDAPPSYILQAHWNMIATGLPIWDLTVLIGGENFRIYTLRADAELHARLIEIGREFWFEHVQKQVIPPIDASQGYAHYLAEKYRNHVESLLASSSEAEAWVTELREARAALQIAEERELLAVNNLKALIGDHLGISGDHWKVTWKKTKDSTVTDWKALAQTLHPKPELVQQFSTTKEGARRFLFTTKETDTNGK